MGRTQDWQEADDLAYAQWQYDSDIARLTGHDAPDTRRPPNYAKIHAAAEACATDIIERAVIHSEKEHGREPLTEREKFLLDFIKDHLVYSEERAMMYKEEYAKQWAPQPERAVRDATDYSDPYFPF